MPIISECLKRVFPKKHAIHSLLSSFPLWHKEIMFRLNKSTSERKNAIYKRLPSLKIPIDQIRPDRNFSLICISFALHNRTENDKFVSRINVISGDGDKVYIPPPPPAGYLFKVSLILPRRQRYPQHWRNALEAQPRAKLRMERAVGKKKQEKRGGGGGGFDTSWLIRFRLFHDGGAASPDMRNRISLNHLVPMPEKPERIYPLDT